MRFDVRLRKCVLNTREWTSLGVLSTMYVYVRNKIVLLENSFYPTENQTKLAIFTKHSNANINTSCCGC